MQIKITIDDHDINPINMVDHSADQVQPHPAQEIIDRLKKTKTRYQVAECVWKEFGNMFFSEINAGGCDGEHYRNARFDCWRYYAR